MGRGKRYDQEYKDMIVDLYKSGMSLAELSSEYGIAKSTINGWIKDLKEIKVDENEVMTLKEVKPYDNAWIESFHSSIKKEEIYRNTYHTFEEANVAIFKYIEGWYNRKRLHSSLNYLTPHQCELLARSAA